MVRSNVCTRDPGAGGYALQEEGLRTKGTSRLCRLEAARQASVRQGTALTPWTGSGVWATAGPTAGHESRVAEVGEGGTGAPRLWWLLARVWWVDHPHMAKTF